MKAVEPPNPSLYTLEVNLSPKRVFSSEGVDPFRAPKSLPVLTSSKFVPPKGFQQ